MVGIVIVSHSAALADGVGVLAREMGGDDVPIETAGGMDDGAIGTDAARVMEAVERARAPEGVLLLVDLGSAVMSAQMAVEMLDPEGGPLLVCGAPLVEGAVAAAALARTGASLDEVAREARGALAMKTSQIDEDEQPQPAAGGDAGAGDGALELRLQLEPWLGLHARPAARIVAAIAGLDARVEVSNATRSRGPADGRSLTGLAGLSARRGDELVFRASGADAARALDALRGLADENFGDPREPPPAVEAPSREPPPPAQDGAAAAPPAPGTTLQGVPASAGIAIGPARRLRPVAPPVDPTPAGPPEAEQQRLDAARAGVRDELAAQRAALQARGAAAEAEIFDAHVALLDDVALTGPAARLVAGGASAGAAWNAAAEDAAAGFRGLEDPLLRERAVDVEDVARRVLARLAGVASGAAPAGAGIVVAGELTPGDTVGLPPEQTWALATARGGPTAHAAILARALGIPAVVGIGETLLAVPEDVTLVLDGDAGTVQVDPPPDVVERARARRDAAAEEQRAALERAAAPAALRDGRRVEVAANVGGLGEARAALAHGAEGVGLLRTEFLFLDRATPPDEEEQAAALRDIAGALEGRPVVVRTLDAGADKPLPFLRQAAEDNPFLGLRGIRLSLAEPEVFATQLRAILRVAEEHPLKVMFPMVSTVHEVRAARAALEEARRRTGSRAELEVGIMVEVPAVALQAAQFAREVDFFSVGTNDLGQYTMAADRGNAALAPLLRESLAAVLALIARVTAAAEAHGRWVGVCGELAGDPRVAVLLAGLGVRELSMAASRIPAVKAALAEVDAAAAADAAREALPEPGPPSGPGASSGR